MCANFVAPGSSGANVPQIVWAGSFVRTVRPVREDVEIFVAPGSSGANVPQIVSAGSYARTNRPGREDLDDLALMVKFLIGPVTLIRSILSDCPPPVSWACVIRGHLGSS